MEKKTEWIKLIGGIIMLITAIIMLLVTIKPLRSCKTEEDKKTEGPIQLTKSQQNLNLTIIISPNTVNGTTQGNFPIGYRL
ncbi:MAG: hypothetical protein GTO45_10835 [Candidatus Aminicenantes bacterium]|nr:hypothetical protein [Candidatus Aminicenantes bacterium]NIM79299.1 hypothetical protein [Candidatus Aminicenantes bacterium]NIN18588.1 hypothetical protein [Candidatus Aminicenantes bacterium]NIN42477.1 hypothetical protein [Candidatus Aminicenantes bacterium]NIN85243.1 hypothetical protein [Candidatus Aminicenantes bacterium]